MTYRVRPVVAATSCLAAPVLVALFTMAIGSWFGAPGRGFAYGAVVGAVLFALRYRRALRRSLTVTDDGVELQYDSYRLVAPWSAVVGVDRRRNRFLVPFDELVVRGGELRGIDADGRPTRMPASFAEPKVATRVRLAAFTRDWRAGPLGDALADR